MVDFPHLVTRAAKSTLGVMGKSTIITTTIMGRQNLS
jgi:hypothetical protein